MGSNPTLSATPPFDSARCIVMTSLLSHNRLTLCTLLLLFGLASACHGGTVAVSTLPQAINAGPFILRLTAASWEQPPNAFWSHDPERSLKLEYSLVRRADGQVLKGNGLNKIIQMRAYAPGHQIRWPNAHVPDGSVAWFPGLDASQPSYNFDLLITDPNATVEQLGEAVNTASYSGIPVSAAVTKPQAVDRRFFTAFGSQCTVNSVVIRQPSGNDPGQTAFDVSIEADAASDMLSTVVGPYTLTDNTGKAIGDKRSWATVKDAGHWTVMFGGVPAAGAKTLDLKFGVNESDPSKRDPASITHVAFSLDNRLVVMPKAVGTISSLANASDGTLTAYIDRYHRWNPTSSVARVWVFDTEKGARREWDVTKVVARFSSTVDTPVGLQEQQYWLLNGAPANPAMTGANIYLNSPKDAASPRPSQLLVSCNPVRRIEGDLLFSSVDVPAGNTVSQPAAPPDSNDESALVLRRVVRVKPHAPNTQASGLTNVRGDSLAVVVDYPVVEHGSVVLKLISATDDRGIWLMSRQLTAADATMLKVSPLKSRLEYTFVVDRPGEQASTIDLHFHIVRKDLNGSPKTIVLDKLDTIQTTD